VHCTSVTAARRCCKKGGNLPDLRKHEAWHVTLYFIHAMHNRALSFPPDLIQLCGDLEQPHLQRQLAILGCYDLRGHVKL